MTSSPFLPISRSSLGLVEPRTDQSLRALAFGSVLTVIAVAALVISVVLWSATRSDQVTKERLHQTVAYALRRSVHQIPYDQESVANWNEAVINARFAFDPKWIDVNIGVWMFDYFKHDRVYVLDPMDHAIYAMADGKQVPAGDGARNATEKRLTSSLRHMIAAGALDTYESGKSRIPRAVDLGVVEGRPAIISVMPLLPHSHAVVQERGTECLIISVRFLNNSFLADLSEGALLDGVRFSVSGAVASGEQSYPLTNSNGTLIGYIIWKPKLPGSTILSEVLPVLAAGLLGVGVAIAFLIRSLRRTYTALATSEAQATHLAFHDTLTGLPNRAYFNDRLEDALSKLRTGQGQLALMFLDLDRFKQVNDTLGHAAGDALIRDLASQLSTVIRSGDVLARMGGDEFAIVMRDVTSREEVEALCHAIVSAASQPFEVLGSHAVVGISIGVAMAPEAALDRSELARKADIALYQAKKNARQRYQFFTEDMSETAQQRRDLECELRQALSSEGELEVVYQPLYSADRLDVRGVEALVRWHHPRLGSVSPTVFVALAEECGLVDELGDWVLRQACKTANAWDLETIAVNVSPIQFRQLDFAERVLRILADAEIPAGRLEIEITESTLLDGSSGPCLNTLRNEGVRIALDDFGTGCTSLSNLMKLEVDRIKIDRSFVRHLGQSEQSGSIVQAIVTMAHAVGVSVTAEGVETHDQRMFLTGIGCDCLQGYLLSPPLSALGLVELLTVKRGPESQAKTVAA